MMKPARLAVVWLTLVFLAGTLFGFVAHSFYADRTARAAKERPQDKRARIIAKLQSELSLSPEQVTQANAIFDQTRRRFQEIHEKMDADSDIIRQDHRQRMMAILTPEQQPKYQKIVEEARRKHEAEKQNKK